MIQFVTIIFITFTSFLQHCFVAAAEEDATYNDLRFDVERDCGDSKKLRVSFLLSWTDKNIFSWQSFLLSNLQRQVALQCRYNNTSGELESCLDHFFGKGVAPFARVTKVQCEERSDVPVEFRFRMCNDNNVAFKPDPTRNQISLRGKIVQANGWNLVIPPKKCRTYTLDDSIDFC